MQAQSLGGDSCETIPRRLELNFVAPDGLRAGLFRIVSALAGHLGVRWLGGVSGQTIPCRLELSCGIVSNRLGFW